MKSKAFWGILLILTAVSLILYGIGLGPSLFGLPIHKLIFALVFVSLIVAKIVYSDTLREKFKIFALLSFLFMVLEPHIASWLKLPEENIINNWLLLLAALLLDIAVGCIFPKRKFGNNAANVHIETDGVRIGHKVHIDKNGIHVNDSDGKSNFANSTIHYADVSEKRYHYYKTNMGSMVVYYQNGDTVEDGSVVELELNCSMGSIVVNVPADWAVIDEINTNMGSTVIRSSSGDRVTLKVTGSNKMGSIVIE